MTETARFQLNEDPVYGLALSPDGRMLISTGGIKTKKEPGRGEVKVWWLPEPDRARGEN